MIPMFGWPNAFAMLFGTPPDEQDDRARRLIAETLRDALRDGLSEERMAIVYAALEHLYPADMQKALLEPAHNIVDDLWTLANLMRSEFVDNHLSPEAQRLVCVALGRIFPEDIHTVERCNCERDPDLDPDETKCTECPREAEWKAADAALTAWEAAYLGGQPS